MWVEFLKIVCNWIIFKQKKLKVGMYTLKLLFDNFFYYFTQLEVFSNYNLFSRKLTNLFFFYFTKNSLFNGERLERQIVW